MAYDFGTDGLHLCGAAVAVGGPHFATTSTEEIFVGIVSCLFVVVAFSLCGGQNE